MELSAIKPETDELYPVRTEVRPLVKRVGQSGEPLPAPRAFYAELDARASVQAGVFRERAKLARERGAEPTAITYELLAEAHERSAAWAMHKFLMGRR